jgi:O-antigen/teichoic acid export membrane protein
MRDKYKGVKIVSVKAIVKFVARDVVIYGVANILSRSVALLTFPLLTRYFSVEEYGLVDLFYLLTTLLIAFFTFGQDSAIFRYYHEEKDNEGRCHLITQSLTMQLGISAVVIPLFWILKEIIIERLGYTSEISHLLDVILLMIPFGVIYTNAQAVLRINFNLSQFLVISIGLTVMMLLVVVLVTMVLDADILLLFQLYLFSWVIFALLGLWFIRKWLVRPSGFLVPKRIFLYGVPMALIVLIGSGQSFFERIIVIEAIGTEVLGLYAAAVKVTMLIALLDGIFQSAFGPFLMSTYKNQDSIKAYNFLLKVFTIGLSIAILILAAFGSSILVFLAGERYLDGAVLVFPLAIAIFIKSTGVFLGAGTILAHKTYIRLIIYVISLAAGLFTMIFLVGVIGVVGVPIGAIVGNSVMLILESIIGQRLWPMAWEYRIVPVMILITIILGYWLTLIEINSLTNFGILITILVFVAVIGWFMINPEERTSFVRFIKDRLYR